MRMSKAFFPGCAVFLTAKRPYALEFGGIAKHGGRQLATHQGDLGLFGNVNAANQDIITPRQFITISLPSERSHLVCRARSLAGLKEIE